jgi:hypothetical protein
MIRNGRSSFHFPIYTQKELDACHRQAAKTWEERIDLRLAAGRVQWVEKKQPAPSKTRAALAGCYRTEGDLEVKHNSG